jgi:hypothetical protein
MKSNSENNYSSSLGPWVILCPNGTEDQLFRLISALAAILPLFQRKFLEKDTESEEK